MPAAPPEIGPYRIVRPLGQGGMGAVYLAYDTRLGREVALKLFSGPQARSLFAREELMREARAAAALNHAHIASVHDVLEVDGQVGIVFEYVHGETLAKRISRGRMSAPETISIAAQLADALAAAHRHGIIHRDLKPANVAITADGVVKVLDFGVAHTLSTVDENPAVARTTASYFVGTVGYAAPEQCLGQTADARADVFSLGVVMFEMLTGERPFAGSHMSSVLRAMVKDDAPRASSKAPDIPHDLDALIERMLAADPMHRPPSAREVLTELQALMPTGGGVVLPHQPKRRVLVAAAVLAAAAITGALVASLSPQPSPPPIPSPGNATPVVAVLPLTNASDDPGKGYLAIGVADSLVTRLAALPGVTVLSRSAVADAHRRTKDIPTLGAELDVTYFVDGTVQQIADGLRIALTVVRRNGAVVWADSVEGPLASIFSLQTRLGSALAQAMAVQLSATDRANLARPPTRNAGALDAYWRGRALLDQRDVRENIDAALSAFNVALRLDPNFVLAHAARVEALWFRYLSTRDPAFAQEARTAATTALRLDPQQPTVRYSLALTLAATGRLDEAIEELQHALAMRPNYDDARRELGNVLARAGRIDEAVAEFRKAIALRPEFWEHYHALGTSLLVAARYPEAIDAFRRVTELRPDAAIGYHQLGSAYYLTGNFDQALVEFTRALERNPTAETLSSVGAIYHLRGRYRDAEDAYRKAIALRPNAPITHRNLGDALNRQGKKTEAQQAYAQAVTLAEQALQVNPTDVETMSSLGVYLAKLGRFGEAVSMVTNAASAAPRNPRVHFRAGVVHALAGDRSRALEALALSVKQGYSSKSLAEEEDLAALRNDPAFRSLVNQGDRP
jgi:serine/threonine-protein kinase